MGPTTGRPRAAGRSTSPSVVMPWGASAAVGAALHAGVFPALARGERDGDRWKARAQRCWISWSTRTALAAHHTPAVSVARAGEARGGRGPVRVTCCNARRFGSNSLGANWKQRWREALGGPNVVRDQIVREVGKLLQLSSTYSGART